MNQPDRALRLMVARAATLSAVLSVVVIGVAYGVAKAMDRPLLAHDLAMAGGLLLLAGLPGLALSVWLTGKVRGGASIGFVAGIAVRLPAGGVVALNGLNWGLAKTASFSQIVAAGYLVFLVIEVLCLSPAAKRTAIAETTTPGADNAPGVEESV
ncbi:MAG: hypothetical protein ACE37H_16285 [Phycisphaeraceae bacterium]